MLEHVHVYMHALEVGWGYGVILLEECGKYMGTGWGEVFLRSPR